MKSCKTLLTLSLLFTCFISFHNMVYSSFYESMVNLKGRYSDDVNFWRWEPGTNKYIYGSVTAGTAGCALADFDPSSEDLILFGFRTDGSCPEDLEIPEQVYEEDIGKYFNVTGIRGYINSSSLKIPSTIKTMGGLIQADYLEIDGDIGDIWNNNHEKRILDESYISPSLEAKHLHLTSNNGEIYVPSETTTEKITFGKNVKTIHFSADFDGKNIIFPDSVEKITGKINKPYGFTFTFGKSIKYIGDNVLAGANRPNGGTNSFVDGNLFLELPINVEYIGDNAFGGTYYKSIKIGKNLEHIGKGAFCSPYPELRPIVNNVKMDGYDKTVEYLKTVYCDKNLNIRTKIENPEDISDNLKEQLSDACLYTEDNMSGLTKCFPLSDKDENKNNNDKDENKNNNDKDKNKSSDDLKGSNIINESDIDKLEDSYNKSSQINTDKINTDGIMHKDSYNDLYDKCSITGSTFSSEENSAFKFACSRGLISAQKIQDANLRSTIKRAELAKIVSLYAINILNKKPDYTKNCKFNDVSSQLQQMYSNGIEKACQLGLMGVGINNFNPYGTVSRAEFGTILSRLLRGNTYNNSYGNRYAGHLNALKNAGILTNTNPDLLELRSRILLMLHRNFISKVGEMLRNDLNNTTAVQ